MKLHFTLSSLPDTCKHLKTEIISDVCHCFSVAQSDCDLTMYSHCKLVMLILALTFDGQGKFSFYGIVCCNVSHRIL